MTVANQSKYRSPLSITARMAALAVGAAAIGVLAMGALAIGALAIGRLKISRAQFGDVEINELTVRRLRVIQSGATLPISHADEFNSLPPRATGVMKRSAKPSRRTLQKQLKSDK